MSTHHLQVGALAQELLDTLGAVPEPRAQEDEVADHNARPVLFLMGGDAAGFHCAVGSLLLCAGCHHQVADHKLQKRHLVVLVCGSWLGVPTGEGHFSCELLPALRVAEKVGHKKT